MRTNLSQRPLDHPRRLAALVVVTVLCALALAGDGGVRSASASGKRSDGSGGRAVAHHSGGRRVDAPAVTSNAPDARLFRIGMNSGEPTVGVTKDGSVFTVAIQTNFRIEVVRSPDRGKSWNVVSPKFPGGRNAQLVSFDPYIYVDEWTNRVYTIDLTIACSYLSYTDDRAETWTTNPLACGRPVNDHQTLFSGPPSISTPTGYKNVVYYCWNDVATSSCTRSLDGGITFTPTGSPPFTGVSPDDPSRFCGGLHGHGVVGGNGTVYLPRGYCGQPFLAISKDEGATWRRVQVAKNGIEGHEAGVAVDSKNNIYYTWVGRDRLPYLAVSTNGGKRFSNPMMIGPPGIRESNLPGIDVGDPGKIAIVYMGSTNSPYRPGKFEQDECTAITSCPAPKAYKKTTWNGYITMSANALSRDPLFYTGSVNSPRDPLKRQNCGPGRCGNSILDFVDIVIGPDGTPWASLVDACITACATTPSSDMGSDGVVGRLVGGPRLR
jgi:hypothetical protein